MKNVLEELKYRRLFLGMALVAIVVTMIINRLPILRSDKIVIITSFTLYIYPCYWIIKSLYKFNSSIKEWFKPCCINWLEGIKVIIMPEVLGIGLLCLIAGILLLITSGSIESDVEQVLRQPTIITIVTTVLVAPISEEIIFRGFILNKMINNWTVKRSIIITSLIFGSLHLNNAISAIISGIVFSILYLKYKNLWATIIPHIIHNLLVVIINFSGRSDTYMLEENNIVHPNSLLVIGICLTILGGIWMVSFINSHKYLFVKDNRC